MVTVDRALKRLVARRRRLSPELDLEAEVGAEVDAALSEYAAGNMKAADARTIEDVMGLNALEFFRLCHLPADHPAQEARRAAHATGWRMMPNDYASDDPERLAWDAEKLKDSRNDGHGWRDGIADDW